LEGIISPQPLSAGSSLLILLECGLLLSLFLDFVLLSLLALLSPLQIVLHPLGNLYEDLAGLDFDKAVLLLIID